MMKKLILFFFPIVLMVGCQSNENNSLSQKSSLPAKTDQIKSNTASQTLMNQQDDLVYYNTKDAQLLTTNSNLLIYDLDLNLANETAVILAINVENNDITVISKYTKGQDITFSPSIDGLYLINAYVSNGETISLTSKAIVDTSYELEQANGIYQLQD
jgi:hypothetical protein